MTQVYCMGDPCVLFCDSMCIHHSMILIKPHNMPIMNLIKQEDKFRTQVASFGHWAAPWTGSVGFSRIQMMMWPMEKSCWGCLGSKLPAPPAATSLAGIVMDGHCSHWELLGRTWFIGFSSCSPPGVPFPNFFPSMLPAPILSLSQFSPNAPSSILLPFNLPLFLFFFSFYIFSFILSWCSLSSFSLLYPPFHFSHPLCTLS